MRATLLIGPHANNGRRAKLVARVKQIRVTQQLSINPRWNESVCEFGGNIFLQADGKLLPVRSVSLSAAKP